MPSGPPESERLRRQLYRPGASTADVDAYTRTREPDPEEPPAETDEALPRRGWRRGAVVAGGVLLIALVAAALVDFTIGSSITAAPLHLSTPSATPTPTLPVVFDRGGKPFAQGASTTSAAYPGLVSYSVAAGDTVIGIASRFGLCQADVHHARPDDFDWSAVQPGATLILGRVDDDTEAQLIRSGDC